MTKAVEDAVANAEAYAVGAKVKDLGVVEISGQDGQFGGGFGGDGAAPGIVAGDWKVSSRVRVACRY